MSCIQGTTYPLVVNLRRSPNVSNSPSMLCVTRVPVTRFLKTSLKLSSNVPTCRLRGPFCLFGDKGKSQNTSEGSSPWKSLEKAMGSFKKDNKSIEDILKQQMTNKEFYEGGGSGSGGGGGGGSGGSGGFGSDESEEEGFSGIINEVVQVTLATLAFVFLYIFIIDGEDITALFKDILKAVFGGKKSFRVQRVLDDWGSFFESLTNKDEGQEFLLEDALLTTPTWYDDPDKYKRVFTSYMSRIPRDDGDDQAYKNNERDDRASSQKKKDDDDDYNYLKGDDNDDYNYLKGDDNDDYSYQKEDSDDDDDDDDY